MQIKTGCELEEVPLNLRPRTPWEIGLYSVSYRSSVYLGPPHNFWATLTADVHISTYLNFSELMYFRCLAPEFEKRKLGSSATKTDQMSSKSMGSWLQTLGRWIKPFSFGFSFQIYLLLRTINSGFCFLCPQGPLGIPILPHKLWSPLYSSDLGMPGHLLPSFPLRGRLYWKIIHGIKNFKTSSLYTGPGPETTGPGPSLQVSVGWLLPLALTYFHEPKTLPYLGIAPKFKALAIKF